MRPCTEQKKPSLLRFRLYLPKELFEFAQAHPEGASKFIEQLLKDEKKNHCNTLGGLDESHAKNNNQII